MKEITKTNLSVLEYLLHHDEQLLIHDGKEIIMVATSGKTITLANNPVTNAERKMFVGVKSEIEEKIAELKATGLTYKEEEISELVIK